MHLSVQSTSNSFDNDAKAQDESDIDSNMTVRTLRSIKNWASSSKNLANQIVIEVPSSSLRKMTKYKGIGSVHRETKHFTGTTTMHGPKRIFTGKGWARAFWIFMVTLATMMLIFQTFVLIKMYLSKPTLSQVSFIVNEGGMDFPAVTICNFNPIKKSYVRELNQSKDLSVETLEYLLQTNMDNMFLFSNLDRRTLKETHEASEVYFANHSDFEIVKFLKTAGYDCEEMFLVCYFGGRRFNCCKYMLPKITSLGKCYQLDLQNNAPEWLRKQISPGAEAGLQIIADGQIDEEILSGSSDANSDQIFSNLYENGFRYFVHPPGLNPELNSEGVSVSPSKTVYSALKTTTHDLLKREEWGNCTDRWPDGYHTVLPYSASACRYLCFAQYFLDICGCSPFTYNIDGKKRICAPYETVKCMDDFMLKKLNDTEYLEFPDCSECHMECESISYNAFNSYGDGFNKASLEWLKRLKKRSGRYVMKNVAVINIFFLEMFYTSYSQVQATSWTEILSDIGGNMGMFLGMSVITITELSLFFSKIFWILFSKKRRQYMYSKKKSEKEKEEQLEEAVKELKEMRSRRSSRENISTNMTKSNKVVPMNELNPKYGYQNSESSNSNTSLESMIELKFDVTELRKKLSEPSNGGIARMRLPSEKEKQRKRSNVPIFTVDPPTPINS